jgi:hypothetical protein
MSEHTQSHRVRNLLLRSPYFILIFLVVPAGTIVCNQFHIPYPVNLLFISNVGFLLTLFLRFVWCLVKMRVAIRYDAAQKPRSSAISMEHSAGQVRTGLEGAGFRFDQSGRYGEKTDLGFPGLVLLYGGLLTALLLGTYDHLAQFTAAVRATSGVPLALNNPEKYRNEIIGSFSSYKSLPLLLVKRQMLPDKAWPDGAAEIALYSDEGEELTSKVIAVGRSFRYGGYEYILTRFTYDAVLSILTTTNHPQYRNYVALTPVKGNMGPFTHYGSLEKNLDPQFAAIAGDAWFSPKDNLLKVKATRDGKPIIDTELTLRGADRKVQGEYMVFFEGLVSWCEMRVFRTRHLLFIGIGAAVALLGGVFRVIFRPQRIWLEEASGGGCRVWAVGRETKNRLKSEDG